MKQLILFALFIPLLVRPVFATITSVGGTSPANANGSMATTSPGLDAHTANFLIMQVGTDPGTSGACTATVGDSSGNIYTPTLGDAAAVSSCVFCSSVNPTVTA